MLNDNNPGKEESGSGHFQARGRQQDTVTDAYRRGASPPFHLWIWNTTLVVCKHTLILTKCKNLQWMTYDGFVYYADIRHDAFWIYLEVEIKTPALAAPFVEENDYWIIKITYYKNKKSMLYHTGYGTLVNECVEVLVCMNSRIAMLVIICTICFLCFMIDAEKRGTIKYGSGLWYG